MNTAPTKFTFRCKIREQDAGFLVDHLYTANRLATCYEITWLDQFGKPDSTTYPFDLVNSFIKEKASWLKDRRPDWMIVEVIEA
jgi:hypothetical protein